MVNTTLSALLRPTVAALALVSGIGPAGASDIEELDANAEAQADSDENQSESVREDVMADIASGEVQKCVSAQRIRRTEVLDDSTVVFHMSNSVVYVNRLRHRCNGLRRADAFSYEVRTTQLCDIDTIRAVDYFGSSVRPGIACSLGKFQPVSDEQLEFLRNGGGDDS